MNWIKSSKCTNDTCVEVAWSGDDQIAVRNSQIPGEIVWFTPEEWSAFIAGAREGEFDL